MQDQVSKRCDESPGPIKGGEEIAYGLYSPELFDPTSGRLTPEAIKLDDLRGAGGQHRDICGDSTGVSVCRLLSEKAKDELDGVLRQIVGRKPNRALEGYAKTRIADVWRIAEPMSGVRTLDVLDDGRPDYQSHAVIRAVSGLSRGALRGPKRDLIELFNQGLVRSSRPGARTE